MITSRLLLAATLLAAVAPARSATADDRRGRRERDDEGVREAKRHFERGEKLYALARFADALQAYQRAFDAKPIPDFLFNIGQCYRNLDDYEAAIFSYRKYLRLAPDAPNREQVEQLIRELENRQQRAESARLQLVAKPRSPEPKDDDEEEAPSAAGDRPIYTRWWFWTGIAVVGAAGGGVVYAATRTSGPPDTSLGNIVFGK